MPSPFLLRLDALGFLEAGDLEVLRRLIGKEEEVEAGAQVVSQGSDETRVFVVNSGWAIRYKTIRDGGRQILNFVTPGDVSGVYSLLFSRAEHTIEALTPMRLAFFQNRALLDAFGESPRLAVVLTWFAGQDARLLAEQIVRVGRRPGAERMAHLLVELHLRRRRAGAGDTESRRFPVTQVLLADALGMSHVHTHRIFRGLARDGFVTRKQSDVWLEDVNGLARLAGFDAGYLEQPAIPAATRTKLVD
ncbi:MAG: Crp/Fnr family transcriptional regulator [Gammaproteobacteria bacterium]|nr:Crp/Fnr family transcriptional regulator [Gammaproteobacteria bacterium]